MRPKITMQARAIATMAALLGVNVAPVTGLLENGENTLATLGVLVLYFLSEGIGAGFRKWMRGKHPPED